MPEQDQNEQQRRQQSDRGQMLLLVLIFYLTFFSESDAPALISAPYLSASERLGRQRAAHGILNSTNWDGFSPHEHKEGAPPWEVPKYLNLTGFRESDGLAWDDLNYFKDRCRQWSKHAYPPPQEGSDEWNHGAVKRTWQNATGTVQGKWIRRQGSAVRRKGNYNLTAIAPGVNWMEGDVDWGWNVTGSHGSVVLRFEEDDTDDSVYREATKEAKEQHTAGVAREISAVATFQDEDTSAASFVMQLYGVHWPLQGSIILTTTSEKFAGIFGLPHFTPHAKFFETSQRLLNRTVDKTLRGRERSRLPDTSNPWNSVIEGDFGGHLPRCEYIMYLQLHALDHHYTDVKGFMDPAHSLIDDLERELRFPSGARNTKTPELQMSLVAWSPDCSYYLESKGPPLFPPADGQHLVGVKEEVLLSRVNYSLLVFTFVYAVQVMLLKGQIKESPTPSTLNRLSFWSMSMMLLADGMVFSASSAWSVNSSDGFHSALLLTFVSFMSSAMGAGLLASIRGSEPERRARDTPATTTTNSTNTTAATPTPPPPPPVPQSSDSLPPPVTAEPPRASSPPIIIPSDQDIDAEIAQNVAAGASAIPGLGPTTNTTATATANNRPRTAQFAPVVFYFFLIILAIMVLTVLSLSWPPGARAIYINTISLLYFSLWLPQIWRNARRNSRRSFSWNFLVGQSLCRLAPFAYFYLYDNNFLFVPSDWITLACLVGWVWAQLLVMIMQNFWEPRLGIPFPRGWMPEVWDYHRILRQDDIESGVVIGLELDSFSSSSSAVADGAEQHHKGLRERAKELKQRGMTLRNVDCAICREEMLVPVVMTGKPDPSWSMADMLERKSYMITPCRHMFHTKCLEQWFRKRLVCPICREDLQPL
ncbi:hypothetical protein QBC40DRAFT_281058 [Triangularia verruculosa]|uniref:RING-type E3 ubiquitin transferase n=1 Tax=Triangularia verruculosa TaxID=2587418 RepID=A0AAN6XGU9_9PEZI|nr:hypothetical protein QBC40DRAFT_281058 [Triangularia verruculosa]